jgi:hypothetical protein
MNNEVKDIARKIRNNGTGFIFFLEIRGTATAIKIIGAYEAVVPCSNLNKIIEQT